MIKQVIIELVARAEQLIQSLQAAQAGLRQVGQTAQQTQAQVLDFAQGLTESVKKFTAGVAGARPALNNFVSAIQQFDQTTEKVGASLAQTTFVMQRLGTLAGAFGAAFSAAFIVGFRVASEFEQNMRNVNTLLKLNQDDFSALTQRVLDIGRVTPQNLNVLSKALYEIASSGFDASDSTRVLAESARAASAGLATVDESVSAVITVLKAYGIGVESLTRVNDILFRSVDVGRFSFRDLAQQLGDFVGIAAQLGVTLEELGAAMAVLTLAGLPAAEAATSLSAVLRELAKPTQDLTDLLRQHGFSTAQAAIASVGFTGVLELVSKSAGNNVAQLGRLFNEVRALRGIVPLVSNDMQTYRDILDKVRQSSGATAAALEEQSKSFAFQAGLLRNNTQVLVTEALGPILPVLNVFVQSLRDVVGGVTGLAREFPLLTSAIVMASATIAVFSGLLGGFLVSIAPIVLLLNSQMIPALASFAARLGGLISVLRVLLSLKMGAFFLAVFAGFEALNKLFPDLARNLVLVVGNLARNFASLVSGAKSFGSVMEEAMRQMSEAALGEFAKRFPLVREQIREFLEEVNRLSRAIPSASQEGLRQIVAELDRLEQVTTAQVQERLARLGVPAGVINKVVGDMRRLADIVRSEARRGFIDFEANIEEIGKLINVLPRAVGSVRVSFGESVVEVRGLRSVLADVPVELERIREALRKGEIGFDEANQRVNQIKNNIVDLVTQIEQLPPALHGDAIVTLFERALKSLGEQVERFKVELQGIAPKKVILDTPEDIQEIRREIGLLNEALKNSADIAVSQANLEAARRLQAARTLDEVIFIEESRAKKVLDIQTRTNEALLRNIEQAQKQIAESLKLANTELLSIQTQFQKDITDEQRAALERRRAETVSALSKINEAVGDLEKERTRIILEQNEIQARFLAEGARRVVDILRELQQEGEQIARLQSTAFVDLQRSIIESVGEVGVASIRGSASMMVEVMRNTGTQVIETEREIQRARLELQRQLNEVRLAVARAAIQDEISLYESRLSRLESAVQAERRIMDIRREVFERDQNRAIEALRARTEEEIRFLRTQRLPRRVVETREAEIRARAAEEEERLRKQIEDRREQDRIRQLQMDEDLEQRRLGLIRRRAELEIELEERAAREREARAEFDFAQRRLEIETNLKLREQEVQTSIQLARLETQARIAQARLEFEARIRLIEAEVQARLAAGQITQQQAAAIFASIAQIRGQFSQYLDILNQIGQVQERRLLVGLEQERAKASSILSILRQQRDAERERIDVERRFRIDEIMRKSGAEMEKVRDNIRLIREELQGIPGEFRIPFQIQPGLFRGIEDAGARIASAFTGYLQGVQKTAMELVWMLERVRPQIEVEGVQARLVPDMREARGGINIFVEGTRIQLTPNEERLFAGFIRRMLGPDGQRVFDEWTRRSPA